MIMMGIYMLILAGSAFLTAWLGSRLLAYIGGELGLSSHWGQLGVLIAAIGFLIVVSLPAGIVLAAMVATAAGAIWRAPLQIRSWPGRLLAVSLVLALIGVTESPGHWPESLPKLVILLIALPVFSAMLFTATRRELSTAMFSAVTIAALVPVSLAPVIFARAHGSLALDAALIGSALIGGMLAFGDKPAFAMLRLPLALLTGYGMVQAAHYGAWPLAIVAFGIWLVGMITMAGRTDLS